MKKQKYRMCILDVFTMRSVAVFYFAEVFLANVNQRGILNQLLCRFVARCLEEKKNQQPPRSGLFSIIALPKMFYLISVLLFQIH